MTRWMVARAAGCVVWFAVGIALTTAVWAAGEVSGDRVRDNLYGTKFVSTNEGWVVGSFGTVARTVDGGDSWHLQSSPTTEALFDVDFVDNRKGWIVGRSGLVLRTDNGGDTWSPQSSGTDKHLFSIDVLDGQHGIAVGDWGTVVVTTDGGNTWQSKPLSEDVILNDVQMLDASTAWTVGEVGTILKSEDGGATWNARQSPTTKTLFGVHFTDAQHGWVVGLDGLILYTADGGTTWEVLHGLPEVGGLEQVQFAQSVENPSLYAVSVIGDQGFVAGEAGSIFTSRDGGRTWSRYATPSDWGMRWLRALSVVPGTHGAIVGADGIRVSVGPDGLQLPHEHKHAATASH